MMRKLRNGCVPHVTFCCLISCLFALLIMYFFVCSGFNVINVKLGNTKYVPCLMVEEMMVDKLNTLALTATLKR